MKWRDVFARLPLPMLALAASYGVWSFNLLFMPAFFAFVSAAAFELTYIGMAFIRTPDKTRARNVALAAVGVSVLYNSLAGLFHRATYILEQSELWIDATLAVLHGFPLALIAYHVADLLLHQPIHDMAQNETPARKVKQVPGTLVRRALAARYTLAQQATYYRERVHVLEQRQQPPALPDPNEGGVEIAMGGQWIKRSWRQLANDTGVPVATLRRKIGSDE